MSVEEASGAVIRAAIAGSATLHVHLDRLILEVKAEMPCYRDDHCGRLCSTIAQGSPWTCQTCQARAELARQLARGADPTWEKQWGDPVPIDDGQMVIESP